MELKTEVKNALLEKKERDRKEIIECVECVWKVVSVDDNNNATTSNDPSKCGVTWTQIKTEMDKL